MERFSRSFTSKSDAREFSNYMASKGYRPSMKDYARATFVCVDVDRDEFNRLSESDELGPFQFDSFDMR